MTSTIQVARHDDRREVSRGGVITLSHDGHTYRLDPSKISTLTDLETVVATWTTQQA